MTGTGSARRAAQTRARLEMKARAPVGSRSTISFTSAPQTKARSPAPVSTTTRAASSAATRASAASSAAIRVESRALSRASRAIVSR